MNRIPNWIWIRHWNQIRGCQRSSHAIRRRNLCLLRYPPRSGPTLMHQEKIRHETSSPHDSLRRDSLHPGKSFLRRKTANFLLPAASAPAVTESTTPTTAEASAPTAAVKASTTAPAVEASASTATTVAAMLSERRIWSESKSCESSKSDQGSRETKSRHNLSFPST